jgi:HAD superfamily hydrolase (TIGR01509 family)
MRSVLVLDAMGVIYRACDDVAELLVPFASGAGASVDATQIEAAYREASLGLITADAFWACVGLGASLEDAYLSGHQLRPGLLDLLERARDAYTEVWCLSNDVGRWSAKLRRSFGLERFFAGWVISGDVGARKPGPAIYEELVRRLGSPADVLFVDDRPHNLAVPRALGWKVLHFAAPSSAGEQACAELWARVLPP